MNIYILYNNFINFIKYWLLYLRNILFKKPSYEKTRLYDTPVVITTGQYIDKIEEPNSLVDPILPIKEKDEYYKELYDNLHVISLIKPGDKILIYNNKLIIDLSYVPSLSRWIYGHTGISSIDFIETQIIDALNLLHNKQIYDKIPEVITGLNNLKITYKTRTDIIDKINCIILRIKT